jgi:ubiquinone/menaquinone biosynthesis C-methylase UbiE
VQRRDMQGHLHPEPCVFPTALAAYALGFVPGAGAVAERAIRFLVDQRSPRGVWHHWRRDHSHFTTLPPSMQGTSLCCWPRLRHCDRPMALLPMHRDARCVCMIRRRAVDERKATQSGGGLPSVAPPATAAMPLTPGRSLLHRLDVISKEGLALARRVVPTPLKRIARTILIRGRARGSAPPVSLTPIRDARRRPTGHTTEEVRTYYEEVTPAYLAGFGEIFQGSRPESNEALIDYIVDAAAIEDGMRVLDAGCGVAGPAIAIAKRRAVTIDGLTIAAAQVSEAERRIVAQGLADRVIVQQGDFHALDCHFAAASFDRVVFLESLCHAESYATALASAHRVLKPGGALYIKDYYAVDTRAHPERAEGRMQDLANLNRTYRLQMPDLASVVDVLTGTGFIIKYMRMPNYEPSSRHWSAYELISSQPWAPASGETGEVIQAVEFFCWKR